MSCNDTRAVVVALAVLFAACNDEALAPSAVPTFGLIGEEPGQVFVVTSTMDAGTGSLRQAILDANAHAGLDGISFEIPAAGPHVIRPSSQLPPITDPVILDGYTQAGASPNTRSTALGSNAVLTVQLDGAATGPGTPGLLILGPGSTVRGLAIIRFQEGIVIVASGNRVQGNFIGTDLTGTAPGPNLGTGVLVLEADNLIGGSEPEDRNVISGNLGDGVRIAGPPAMRNVVAGNFIGLDASGTAPLPNGVPEPAPANSAGVHITENASLNLVGGTETMPASCEGPCNVIAGNHRSGVWIENFANQNIVDGNLIGAAANGDPMGNVRWGVFLGSGQTGPPANDNVVVGNRIEYSGRDGIGLIGGSSGNRIGGSGVTPGMCDGPCNRIAFNGQSPTIGGDGIRIYGNPPLVGSRNSFLGNSISENPRGLAIDIVPDGPTPNDPGDLDGGENGRQNFPELTSATVTPGRLFVRGIIDTPNPQRVLVEIYGNAVPIPGGDESGFGEGAVFLGRAAPASDGSFAAGLLSVPPGTLISATATDEAGNTSELARNIEAVPHRGPDGDDHPRFLPFSFTIGGCGEPVLVTGSFHEHFQFRADPAGGTHFVGHINAVGVGVGQITGAIYNWNDLIRQQGTFRGLEQTFTSIQNTRMIGLGSASDMRVQARFHVTVTPSGVVSVILDDVSAICT